MKTILELKEQFAQQFGPSSEKTQVFFSPGRVNLLGEHIDYNGGYVFPCALSFGTYGVARKRTDNKIRLATTNFDYPVEINTSYIVYDAKDQWANYSKGVASEFINLGFSIGGFDLLVSGNIPNGAGLSSSASLELLTSMVLKTLFSIPIEMVDMVQLSQRAENNFVGMNCGIMDQFAIGMGKENRAILLDCNSLAYEYVPITLTGSKLIIGNTNKRRELADSKYNERRQECESALADLQKKLPIRFLCDLDSAAFEENKHLITSPISIKRAEHAVFENQRVKDAVSQLKSGNVKTFGELMNSSHRSLRDLYEVTGDELDIMVEEAWNIKGTIGSRMTGAGFGGCTISIVEDDFIDEFILTVGKNYEKRTGLHPEFYIAEIGNGTQVVE